MNKNKVATTVKVESTLYDEFKVLGVRHKLTLQGLVEKSVYRYVKEEVFRNETNNFNLPLPPPPPTLPLPLPPPPPLPLPLPISASLSVDGSII